MPPGSEPVLSLPEWIVLSLVGEGVTHGHAVTRQLARSGGLGQVWNVQKAVVYRSLDRLSVLGLIRSAGEEDSPKGPARLLVEATDAGRAAAVTWQQQPAQHTRDIRSELLVKLALLDRSRTDPHDLLMAQRAVLAPAAEVMRDRIAVAAGFERTLLRWRYETTAATLRFLDALLVNPSDPLPMMTDR
ncbi:MAG TPA: helix-turn-helix transcriptional regulator [Streptosporangiaceae bacterium]|nr:helix-turn-helix transcriptional regulator [Streptosporangiaceae bacterium]